MEHSEAFFAKNYPKQDTSTTEASQDLSFISDRCGYHQGNSQAACTCELDKYIKTDTECFYKCRACIHNDHWRCTLHCEYCDSDCKCSCNKRREQITANDRRDRSLEAFYHRLGLVS